MAASEYEWALSVLNSVRPFKLIAEVGSMHARDAVWLSKTFACPVFVFEPDPDNAKVCATTIAGSGNNNIRLFELALCDENREIDFHAVDPAKMNNTGASSMFPINFSNRGASDPDRGRAPVQRVIKVQGARYDSLNLPAPDLIAMDVQGAELLVLKGFGPMLGSVKAIVLETMLSENYVGGSRFSEVDGYLARNGFRYVRSSHYGEKRPRRSFKHWLAGRYQQDFNCVYVNDRNPGT